MGLPSRYQVFLRKISSSSKTIVDEPGRYEVTVDFVPFATAAKWMTANITPRRLQKFTVAAGKQYAWKLIDLATGKAVQTGRTAAGADGALTLKDVKLYRNKPHRLVIVPAAGLARDPRRKMLSRDTK